MGISPRGSVGSPNSGPPASLLAAVGPGQAWGDGSLPPGHSAPVSGAGLSFQVPSFVALHPKVLIRCVLPRPLCGCRCRVLPASPGGRPLVCDPVCSAHRDTFMWGLGPPALGHLIPPERVASTRNLSTGGHVRGCWGHVDSGGSSSARGIRRKGQGGRPTPAELGGSGRGSGDTGGAGRLRPGGRPARAPP